MRRPDSPAHLLVRRGAFRSGPDLSRAGTLHCVHGHWNFRDPSSPRRVLPPTFAAGRAPFTWARKSRLIGRPSPNATSARLASCCRSLLSNWNFPQERDCPVIPESAVIALAHRRTAQHVDIVKGNMGWIEVIVGPMFSGKSEELIRRLRRAEIGRQRVQIFKPVIDQRYAKNGIVSHSGLEIPSELVQSGHRNSRKGRSAHGSRRHR